MLRLALVGCGEHSRISHATPLARYAAQHPGEIELAAACDLDSSRAEEFCQTFGFLRSYTDLENMLATESLDACVCVMPMELIVDFGIRMLQRRMPCVIEKPLGTSLADAEKLERVARETNTPHMVSVNRRFMPYLNKALSCIQDYGPVQYVRATQIRDARTEADFIWSTAIHVLDALRYAMGEIVDFSVQALDAEALSARWYNISLKFESGATGHVEVLPTAGMVEESYEFFGDGFRTRVTSGIGIQRSLHCWKAGNLIVEAEASETVPDDLRNGSYQEVEEFVGALKSGRHPRPEVKDILPSVRICFAIADIVNQQAPSN